MRRSHAVIALIGTVLAAAGCMRATANAEGTPLTAIAAPTPKLLVFITVDQLRGDMLARYQKDLRFGFRRLMTGGAWFTRAYQDHAITETAPGHASTMSGRFPRSTGIVSNTEGVNTMDYPLLSGLRGEWGASPDRFRGTTLFDWLHAKDSRARALSVSRKDRGAILPIGKAKQDVYWFSANGSFTTSTYYRDTLPAWVRAFNNRHLMARYAGTAWTLTRPPATYSELDSVPWERGGRDFMFPHRFPTDTLGVAAYIGATPSMDSITALFALEGLRQTNIGRGPQTDILAVSFSATDYVGHSYGPDSREAHENEIRLDETIGWFLDSIYAVRDPATVVVALTGDHGVSPIPELARARGEATGNQGLRVSIASATHSVRAGLQAAGVDTMALEVAGEIAAVQRGVLAAAHLNPDSLLDAFARAARAIPGVARVDRLSDLRKADLAADPIARRWVHQIPADYGADLVVTLTRYSYWGTIPATHGSPYDQDALVPIIFYGPGIKTGQISAFARTVDIAPTLAQLLGARPLEKLDGHVLVQALK